MASAGDGEATAEEYHGGHRREAGTWGEFERYRVPIAAAAALVLISAAITVSMLLRGDESPLGLATPIIPTSAPPTPATTPPGVPATTTATPRPTPSRTARPTAAPTRVAPTTTRPPTTPPPPPPPVTYQAEAATLGGSAAHLSAPCGAPVPVVGHLGAGWGGSPGTVTFSASVPTAGEYTMTVRHYIPDDPWREVQVRVNGAAPTTIRWNAGQCALDRQVRVSLRAGANTIELGNPLGRAPMIDYIVIAPGG